MQAASFFCKDEVRSTASSGAILGLNPGLGRGWDRVPKLHLNLVQLARRPYKRKSGLMTLRSRIGVGLLGLCCASAVGADGAPDWLRLIRETPAVQAEWATRYEHGEGVPQNYDRALRLYCAAARRGHVQAQYQLGWMYANGRGVTRNDPQAAAWFRRAAARGDLPARRMLARVGDPARVEPATCAEPVDPTRHGLRVQSSVARSRSASPQRARVEALVNAMAPAYGLQPALVLAVIEAESDFNDQARSVKNAQGLMQLIPATAERFGVQDPYDPVQNLRGGMAYLRWLLSYFQGDVRLTLAGYNAGEGAVVRHGGVPPYAETQAYVDRITRVYRQQMHPSGWLNLPATPNRPPFAAAMFPPALPRQP
jgi:hypothetical protein